MHLTTSIRPIRSPSTARSRSPPCSRGGWWCLSACGWSSATSMRSRRRSSWASRLLIHAIVIGSGLWIHGGSADGAMAAIVSDVCSALYVRWRRHMHAYICRNQWHPGVLPPRQACAAAAAGCVGAPLRSRCARSHQERRARRRAPGCSAWRQARARSRGRPLPSIARHATAARGRRGFAASARKPSCFSSKIEPSRVNGARAIIG
jgi:hypothetical protein